MLFTLKVGTIWHGLSSVGSGVQVPIAQAAESDATPEAAPSPDPRAARPATAPASAPKDAADRAPGAPSETEAAPAADTSIARPGGGEDVIDPQSMSRSEVRLLQALAGRRQVLDQREQSLNQREALLKVVASSRIC